MDGIITFRNGHYYHNRNDDRWNGKQHEAAGYRFPGYQTLFDLLFINMSEIGYGCQHAGKGQQGFVLISCELPDTYMHCKYGTGQQEHSEEAVEKQIYHDRQKNGSQYDENHCGSY